MDDQEHMDVNELHERSLEFDDPSIARELFGPGNDNLSLVARKSGVDVSSMGSRVTMRGEDRQRVDTVANLFTQVYGLLKEGRPVLGRDLAFALETLMRDPSVELAQMFKDSVYLSSPKKTVAPKTLTQRAYVQAVLNNDLVFAIGPAGTGKTYLAVAMAVKQLMDRRVKRLVLTRPAVEAGEKLGFLPGDLVEKVNPYLRPLYDALHDMLDFRRVQEMLETGIIEIAPLAFMRGRTLNDAFIILDEAQNTTPEQMKMFLTRMGFGSKAVVTGDVTQIDLPERSSRPGAERSGLVQASRILENVKSVGLIRFGEGDVIRHDLVARIVKAYEHHEKN